MCILWLKWERALLGSRFSFLVFPGLCSGAELVGRESRGDARRAVASLAPPLACWAPPLTLPAARAAAVRLRPARLELLRLPRPALQPPARLATWTDSWRADLTWFQHRLGLAALAASLCSPPPLSSVPMAALMLEDGSVLRGQPFGATVSTAGEVGKQARAGCRPHPTLCCPSLPSLPCPNPPFSRLHTLLPPPFGAPVPIPAPFIPQGQGSHRWGIVIAQDSVVKDVLPEPQPCPSPSPAFFLQCFKPAWSATPRPSLTLPTKHRS